MGGALFYSAEPFLLEVLRYGLSDLLSAEVAGQDRTVRAEEDDMRNAVDAVDVSRDLLGIVDDRPGDAERRNDVLRTATPTSSNLSPLYCSYTLARLGISALQGPHQLAQKSTRTYFPFPT